VKPAERSAPLGVTGRADLLRALAVADRDHLALDVDASSWFGYVRLAEPSPREVEMEAFSAPRIPALAAPSPEHRLPLRLPFMHLIVERVPRERPEAKPESQDEAARAGPIEEKDARAPSAVRLIRYEDLVPEARLLPALRRSLGATRVGPLDLERLTHSLAARALPRHLPRRALRRWHPELVVLLDFCPRLWPYREDMHRLAERLLRHCGRSGVSLRIINHGPWGPWSDWVAHQDKAASAEPPERPWVMPRAGTPVLIASDLGLLLGQGSGPARAWVEFTRALVRAEVRPLALAPLGAKLLDAGLSVPIQRWSPDAPARPGRALGPARPNPDGLDDLLAMVAATRRVDPPLLRAMRRLNPRAPLDAGLEGALWCHPDVDAGFAVSIRPEAQEVHLRRFTERLPELHAALNALRTRHHAHFRAVLNHEENLLWTADPVAAKAGREFMSRLAATLEEPGSLRFASAWWAVAKGIVQRAGNAMGARHSEVLTPLAAALRRVEGDKAMVPGWVDPAKLASLLTDRQGAVSAWLVQDAASRTLVLQAEPAGARQNALGEALVLDAGGARVRLREGVAMRWLSARNLPQALTSLGEPTPVLIETATEAITVAPVGRPRGALGWRCGRDGIAVESPSLGPYTMRWSGDALRSAPLAGAVPTAWALEGEVPVPLMAPISEGAVRFGIDTPFGVYADLTVTTRHGSATQRLRWIEPGSFLMGSPEGEPERYADEGPRHTVTLTHGFWLADSACTQALWRAVMESNPSRFTGDERRPVEQVSWHDVQRFLRELEALLPGCEAALPTEAEWEYACRAGSDTPFSFGAQITPEQVNYDGNYPYAGKAGRQAERGGAKGLYRATTVPVKSLPPNAWGLYEMHGNVWEWCADGMREYTAEAARDPVGPVGEGAGRVFRGGSWIVFAREARSAVRVAFLPGNSADLQGFRLCLGSIEPGQGGPGGPAGSSRGAHPEGPNPPRDEAGLARAKRLMADWLRPKKKR
jgi:formylglycine-generating enzyme required for sulfatase activity